MILNINNLISLGGASNPVKINAGVKGLERPNSKVNLVSLARDNRSLTQSNRFDRRQITFSCVLFGSSLTDFYQKMRALQDYLYNFETEIPFTLTTFETTPTVYQSSGLINIDYDLPRLGFGEFEITITCPDPYFRSVTTTSYSLTFAQNGIQIPFQIPSLIGSGLTNNTVTVVNGGGVEIFADLLLTGPFQNITIWNQTTNKFTTIGSSTDQYVLSAGNTLNISNFKVLENGVTNRYNYLSGYGALKLAVGSNVLQVVTNGSNTAATTATFSFKNTFDHL
jgi:hypothetical protein